MSMFCGYDDDATVYIKNESGGTITGGTTHYEHIGLITWFYGGSGGDPKPKVAYHPTTAVPLRRDHTLRLLTHSFDKDSIINKPFDMTHSLTYTYEARRSKKITLPVITYPALTLVGNLQFVLLNHDIEISKVLADCDPDPTMGFLSISATPGGCESCLLVSILNKV